MTEENTRILKLFYAIIGSSGFVKAGELAGLLQTSERTVKSSMEELKTFARITGHSRLSDLSVEDLCTASREISEYTDIPHA